MGDIKKSSNNYTIYQNQLINILRSENSLSKKSFKLKGPSGFLFSNFAMLALAACGGGGGGGGSTPTPPASNTNNAPSMGANTTFSFSEDTPASFGIGAPTDADGDSLTITVQSIPTGGTLTLSDGMTLSVGSTITLSQLENITFTPNENINSSTNTIGDLVLTVTDGNGGSDSATFTFIVTAVNDAPSDITLSTLSIDENTAGAIVGSITSTDIDSTSSTFTISGDDAAFFEITNNGSLKLKDNVSADFEAKSSYSITITATDPDGDTLSKTFTVSVTDVNDAPTAIGLSSLVFDENTLGASVGTVNVIDSDISDDFIFTITGNDKDFFEVVDGTLKLIDTASADYESKSSFSITITATDSAGISVSENLTLLVNDLEDPETISGTVVDGYVSGSTVKILDANGNTLAETTTNSLGQYSFDLADNKGVKIVAEGGIDTLTGEAVTVTLTASKNSKFVSALTTIVDAAGSDAATILTNLGLPADFDLETSNPLSNIEAQKINASLINIMAVGEALLEGSGLTDGQGDELIVLELVKTLKTSTDFNSTTAIKSIIDSSTANLSDDIKAKATGLAQNVAESIAISNAQILKAGSISQIAAYQKAVLDDENSLLSSIFSALNDLTTFVTSTAETIETAAREAALTLGVNVSPFITLDSIVNIKENIVAGDGVAIATVSDPEGEDVTLTLGGTDAALFTIDVNGKLSFIKSPNFSAPKDADQNNVYSVDVIATDASGNTSIKTILVNVIDVKGQGQAIDGYLVGATVWADIDNDGIIDPDEPTTTTDQTGAFGLDTDLAEGTVLYVTGGYDLGTGKPNEQTFKMTVSSGGAAGTEELIISPVSTQISRAFATGTVTLDEANEKVAKAYGLDEAFDNLTSFDPIQLAYTATSDEQAKAALTAQAKNIMVSTLGSTSSKVAEYFTTEIAPVVRTQITDLFKNGTQILSYTSWDSAVDLRAQPRITIELEGFEELLAKSSDVFNDKIIEAILASNDLDKLFEMKKDGTGQFDVVISNATSAIITEIKNTVLEEMGFDPATNYTTFKDLSEYEGETVTFLGSTKTMGEWAVIISDVLDSDRPGPSGKVSFGPDGGVTDMAGKFYAEKVATIARHIEVIIGKPISELTDDQIDSLVDMGMRYERGSTFNDSYSEWVPFDEYGQELWENNVWLKYSGTRFNYDSNGNNIQGNSGQYLLTPDQLKAYLKDPAMQLKTGNWGNDFTTYNWSSTVGDLGLYLGLARARDEADVAAYMNALTPSEESMNSFKLIIDGFFTQGEKVFKNLVSGALDFTLDKFQDFVEQTFEMDRDEVYLNSNSKGLPVSTVVTQTINGEAYELKTTSGIEWLVRSGGDMNFAVNEEGNFTYSIVGGPDADRFRIDNNGSITFKENAPGELARLLGTSEDGQATLETTGFKIGKQWGVTQDYSSNEDGTFELLESGMRLLPVTKIARTPREDIEDDTMLSYFDAFNVNNLQSIFNGNTGQSPVLSYVLKGIPAAGESGTAVLTLSLINERYWDGVNRDATDNTFYNNTFRTTDKETLESSVTIEWSSDGENVTITFPDQTQILTYTNGSGTEEVYNFTSPDDSSLSVSNTEDGLRSLDFHISSLFLGDLAEGESFSDNIKNFIQLGAYTFEATFDSGISIDDDWDVGERPYALEDIKKFISLFDVTTDTVVMSATNQSVSEGDGNAEILVTLSRPLDYDFTTQYQVLGGDQFGSFNPATPGQDFEAISGTITFFAGQTEVYINVPVIFDGITETLESFSVQFPDFYGMRILDGDGSTIDGRSVNSVTTDLYQVSSFNGVSLNHSLSGTLINLFDTTVAGKDNVGILDDADQDGEYLVTVRVQDGDASQDFDVILKFPDWNDQPRPLADSYSFLNPDQKIIEMNEHTSLFTDYNRFEVIEGSISTDPNWKLADGIKSDGLELASRRVEITDWINTDAANQDQSVFVSTNSGLRGKNPGISKSRIVDESNQPQVQELPAIPNPTVSSAEETGQATTPTPAPTPTPTPTSGSTSTPTPAPTPTSDDSTPADNIPYGPKTYEILVNSTNSDGSVSIEYTDAWIVLLDNWGLWDAPHLEGFSQVITALAVIVSENSTSGIWSLSDGAIITEGSELDNIEFWTAYDEALVTFGFDYTPTTSFQDVMDRVWEQLELSDYRTGFTIVDDPVQTNFTEYDAGPFNAEVLKYTTLSDSGAVQITLDQGLQLWAQTILGGGMGSDGQQMLIVDADYFATWLSQATGIPVPMPATSSSYADLNTTEFYDALSIVIAGSTGFVNNFDDATQIWFDNVPNPDAVQGWELKTDVPDSLFDWVIRYPVNEGKFSLDLQDPSPYLPSDNETPSDQTFVVTVQSTANGNKYFIDGVETPSLNLSVGATYTFDQSDASNANHPFRFSDILNGIHSGGQEFTTGVVSTGTAGTAGASTSITITADTPTSLYFYCVNHSGMGGEGVLTAQAISNNNIEVTAIPDDGTIEKADGTILKIGDILTPEEVTQLSYTPTIALIENSIGDTFEYSVGDDSVTVTLDKGTSGTSENVTFTWYNPIHVDNLDSLFTDGTGQSPTYSYNLSGLPADGQTGSATVTTTMFNGRDWSGANQLNTSFYGGPESDPTKKLETTLTFDWSSDGQSITFNIPDQQVIATLTTADGSTETIIWENVNKDFISVSIDENGQPSLDLQITSLLLGAGQGTGVDLSDFINVGRYGLEVDFEGLSWSDNTSQNGPFSNFASMIDVTSNKVTAYSQDVVVVEGEEAVFTINLSMANTEDIYIDFELQGGSATGLGNYANENQDYEQITGSVLIPAGETSVEVRVPVYIDDQNEEVEAFRITFPDFNAADENGIAISQYNGVNMSHPFGTVEALILNQAVETARYKGYKLNITNPPKDGYGDVRLDSRDNNNNPIKDNSLFYIHRENGEYYLKVRGGTLDFDAPQDTNKDNIYELTLSIIHYGQGNEDSVMTNEDMIIVVNEGQDPSLTWQSGNDQSFVQEHNAPVASLQTVQAGEKTLEAYFSVGYSLPIRVNTNSINIDNSGTPESILRWSWDNNESIVYTITGGADAALFNIINGEVYFNERPSFSNPSDADGDNLYEVEVTASAGGTTIQKLWKIQVGESSAQDLSKVVSPPTELSVFTLKEKAELIGDSQAPRNINGTDGNDLIKIDPHQFQYIHAGLGDDIIDPGRDWGSHGHITGGEGGDIFLFRSNYMQDSGNFGIRDYSLPYDQNGKDGINGYDQNRDGILDLDSELDWSHVVLIADFTPGQDKIALTVSGDSGFNRKDLTAESISFVQGTGELSDHTLIVTTVTDRGFTDDIGILGVLLDTDASTLDVARDVDSVGAKYEAILGQIDLGANTVKITDTEGNPVSVQQLPNGQYLWFEADNNVKDNDALHSIFTVSTDGIIYAGRPSQVDFENPRDADKDNFYEFVITARIFDNLVLEPQSWGYQVDWNASTYSSEIKISSILNIQDDINDNLGKISIAEASYMNADGTVNQELVELVLRQITAVQGSMADIDFRSIAEEINFDFSFFTTADAELMANDWFEEDMNRQFDSFNQQLEETFERNLLNKYNDFTDANSLGNLVGDAADNIIKGKEGSETIFGKAGNDTIAGGEGNDVIFGDQGQDTLSGGPGDDKLDGGAGSDRLIVDEGADVIDGGAGNDTILFSSLSELPEFVSGGGGEDTLVLAGMPTTIGTTDLTHDNNAYNGVDLKKIVSAKETWSYIDSEGNTVNEEGWRNRLESIEVIDLRDSESLLNTQKTFETYNDFQLNSNYFTVTDYIGSEGNALNTYKTKIIPYSEAEVGPNFFNTDTTDLAMALGTESVLDYTNLQNLFSVGPETGKAPVFSFGLKSIPEAGQQGTVIVKFTLKDGYPDYWFAGDVASTEQYASTKTLKANIKLNWVSDGTTVKITMPPQTVAVSYESSEVLIQDEFANTVADILSVSTGSNGTPQLDLKLTNLFSQNTSDTSIDMSAFFDVGGRYFLTTEFEGLDVKGADANNNKSAMPFEAIQTLFRVEDGNLNWYSEDVIVNEDAGSASVIINISRPVDEDVTFTYVVYPATYGFINDDDTLETVKVATGADFADGIPTWVGPNGENYPVGTVTIPAGSTSATVSVPIKQDTISESSEFFLTAFFGAQLSDGTEVTKSSRHPQVEIENSTVFNDVLNISLDTLWRMSWDNRTWTIRGDDTDTVRLVGYESSYDGDGDGTLDEYFEPFRFEGQQTVDGVIYNIYDLWDARVLIEDGVTVIYKKRELGKVKAGENSSPDFWYKYTTVKENQTDVFGAVRDSYDADGDTLTYSIDATYGDGWLFDINTSTGELTWKNSPDFESPKSQQASGIDDFSSYDANSMRYYNEYRVKVIADDGSGESNATREEIIRFNVKNVPDYEGYDPTNKIPFFKDMWGDETKFIDDAADQSIKIKGFDLDFDTLTWEITGMYAWGNGVDSKGWGTIWDSYRGNAIEDAPLQISSTGVVTPKTTLSYENGFTRFEIVVSITDGKSTPVTKQYYLQLEDSIADGSYEVEGLTQLVGYLSGATVWQDLDNDGVQDGSEPFTTTNGRGEFTLALSEATQDTPILVKGGMDLGTGLENTKVFGINSNLSFAAGNDWGRYTLTPLSDVTLAIQELDRSKNDKDTVIDIYKSLGFENGWVEGDGNYHGDEFHRFNQVNNFTQYPNDWDMHQFNLYVVHNLINLLGDVASKGAVQISESALEAVVAAVTATTGASGISTQTFSQSQLASLSEKGYEALIEALAETITGLTAYDGFRLGEETPVNIIDHEMIKGEMSEVKHTPGYTVSSEGVMTLDTSSLEINRSTLQDALNLTAGAKGLKVEVELGSLPSSDETIQFSGKLIDGSNSTVDLGERAIEVRFNLTVDASETIGSSNYAFVPSSESLTVIYTGEDGTVSTTTLANDGSMVTIENPTNGGAPVVKVDMMTLFSKAIPKTDLSTYFTDTNGTSGDYYVELDFAGGSLKTYEGQAFTKVVAPFKVADAPKPIVYISDITINENRGWEQLEVRLSKPATETFTIDYKFTSDTAIEGEDYWWWTDWNTDYRQITFLEGQSSAIINLDVRNDDAAESNESFNIDLTVNSESAGKLILGTDQVTVTIIDDDGSVTGSTLDNDVVVSKVISKVSNAIATEIKSITDANSGTFNSSSTIYSDILVSGNADITDVSTYIATKITEQGAVFDGIISSVMAVVEEWTNALRGPNMTNLGYGIDPLEAATDLAALTLALDKLDLSTSGILNAADAAALKQAIVDDIYTNSGFKFTGEASIVNNLITPQRDVQSSSVYDDVLMPAGKGLVSTHWDNVQTVNLGTSGNDTVTVTNSGERDIFYGGGAGNDVITIGSNLKAFVQGGAGNDTIKTTSNEYHRLQGGPGDDILNAVNFNQVLYEGGTGNDLFVIEASSDTWLTSQNFNGNDRNGDNKTDFLEMWQRPGVIYDFKDGQDKIGLKGDWSGKTVVIKQGSNEGGIYNSDMSSHTFIYASSKDSSGNYDNIIAILANTAATSITSADFVTVDASYNQTAVASSLSDLNFLTSINIAGGTNVGPAQNGVLVYNTLDTGAITFSISGGNDAALFNIDANTGSLTFKSSVSASAVTDFNRDGSYDVTVTASQGGSNKSGNVAVSVVVDKTLASYSDLKLVTALDAEGKTVAYMTGKLTDDSAPLLKGEINITLVHATKGARLDFRVNKYNEGSVDADGTFTTSSQTLSSTTPDGSWYVQYVNLEDASGNRFNEYYRNAKDSSPLSTTLDNPLYLGNDDTTIASYSDLALKYITTGAGKEISITGKLMDDGNPLLVADLQITLVHQATGARKYFYLDAYSGSVASDGTFETRSEQLRSSDPSGTWAVQQIRLTDDAGNRVNIEYQRSYDSTDLSVNLINDGYTGDTDTVGTTISNYAIVQTTNWEGKPAIAISGLASEQFEWLNIGLKHTASGQSKWFHANEWQLNSDNTFETYAQSFGSNDPSGTWYVYEISVKDQAGNETRTEIRGAQESSPFKTVLTNPNYSGGSPADSSAADLTAPVLNSISATVVDDGDGTYSLTISGNASDVGGTVNGLYLRFNHAEDAGAPSLDTRINNASLNQVTGDFSQTISLDDKISGTYVLKRFEIYDNNGNEIVDELVKGAIGSPLENLSFTHTSTLSLTDKSAPVLSNLSVTKQNDGDETYTLVVSGNLSDATALTGQASVYFEFTNVTNGEATDFGMSTNTFDGSGNFTISRTLDDDKSGTWNLKNLQLRDANGNQVRTNVEQAGAGSPIQGKTYDIAAGSSSNAGDKSLPTLTSFASTVVADGDGTYTLQITGNLSDPSGIDYFNFRFANENNTADTMWTGTNNFDGSGNFTINQNLDVTNPGKYFIDYFSMRDGVGNEFYTNIGQGGSSSPLKGQSFTYAANPTAITLPVTSLDEETLGLAIGKVSVNGQDSLGLYTIAISGTDASSLEISSKGFLRLKDNVKLDHETKTTLEFTLKATNSSSQEFSQNFSLSVNNVVEASFIAGVTFDDLGLVEDPTNSEVIFGESSGDISIDSLNNELDVFELGIELDTREEIDGNYKSLIDYLRNNQDESDLLELESQIINNPNQNTGEQLDSYVFQDIVDEEELLFIQEII